MISSASGNNYEAIVRGFFLFDTSSLGANAKISSATISFRGTAKQDDLSQSITIVLSNPASNTAIVASDYNIANWTMKQQNSSDITIAAWNISGYNDFALSATGIGNISTTGISKFGSVLTSDRDNVAPSWGANLNGYISMNMAEAAGTTTDPKLVVVYDAAPTSPTSLLTEGQTNPTNVIDPTPEFSAVYNDPEVGDTATLYRIQVSASSANWSSLMWDSGTSTMALTTQGSRSPDIAYAGTALKFGSTYWWRIKFWDNSGAEGAFSSTSAAFFTMLVNSAPTAPTSLLAEGLTNPSGVMSLTPKFSAIYNDSDTGDTAHLFWLQVSASSANWSSLMWDSGTSTMASTTQGNRSPDITYGGSPLSWNGSTYYWRIKFWDAPGAEGAYSSTSAASFTMGSAGNVIQNISYTYDAVGNITLISNSSPTNASSTASYVYDDLYRLTSVTVTSTPVGIAGYTQTYAYDALGNITNKSDVGSYVYATATTTGYANPDAAIYMATSSVIYDKNGNVTSVAVTSSAAIKYTWDYLNRLNRTGLGTTTSTYGYDPWGQRVKMTVATSTSATTTTFYPSRYYNISSGSTTSVKHIFANGEEIATVSGSGTKATITYIHTDHLGGANVVTNGSGAVAELSDYYPYGSSRLDQQTSFNEQRKFIGEMYDPASQLSYLNARYYNGSNGKFLSQDPIFQLVGDQAFAQKFQSNWRFTRGDSSKALQQYLANPQALNSYSYSLGNPVRYSDPSGEFVPVLVYLVLAPVAMFVAEHWEDLDTLNQLAERGIESIPSREISVDKTGNVAVTTDRLVSEPLSISTAGTTTFYRQDNSDSKHQRNKKTLLDSSINRSTPGGGGGGGVSVNAGRTGSQGGASNSSSPSQSYYYGIYTAIQAAIAARPSRPSR
jgi:RHS repeat-associated protein